MYVTLNQMLNIYISAMNVMDFLMEYKCFVFLKKIMFLEYVNVELISSLICSQSSFINGSTSANPS